MHYYTETFLTSKKFALCPYGISEYFKPTYKWLNGKVPLILLERTSTYFQYLVFLRNAIDFYCKYSHRGTSYFRQ